MLNNTENSHLRKYLATLGISIIGGSLGAGGLILRSGGDILVKKNDIEQLTPVAQEALKRRQHLSLIVAEYGPYLVLVGLIVGAILAWYGLHGWAKRQKLTDQREDTEHQRAKLELRQLTEEERRKRAEQEMAAEAERTDNSGTRTATGTRVKSVLDTENALVTKLRDSFPENEILANAYVNGPDGRRYVSDALIPPSGGVRGYALEVKLLQGNGPQALENIRRAAQQATSNARLLSSSGSYADTKIVPVVIWVHLDGDEKSHLINGRGWTKGIDAPVLAFSQSEFNRLSGRELRRILEDLNY